MTEFRVRDVFTAAHAADRAAGAHRRVPGPGQPPRDRSASTCWPRRTGCSASSSWALEAGTVVIHLAAIATALWIGAPPAGLEGRGRRRRPARRRRARLRPGAADPAVEPVPAAAGVDRRAAGDVGGAVRRPPDARPARRRRHVLRPDPRAVPAARRRAWSCSASAPRPLADPAPPSAPTGRRRSRSVAWSVGVGVVLWLPPVADQSDQRARQHPPARSTTSARRRRRRSASATASASPCATSTSGRARRPARRDRPVRRRPPSAGVAPSRSSCGSSPPSWRGASASPALRSLHVVVAVALVARHGLDGRASSGGPWFYLTLWAWGVTARAGRRRRLDGA